MEEFEIDVGECNGKRCFDKLTAEIILKRAKSSRKSKQWRKECRIYKCPDCSWYHLTSQEKNNKIKEFKKKYLNKWKKLINYG